MLEVSHCCVRLLVQEAESVRLTCQEGLRLSGVIHGMEGQMSVGWGTEQEPGPKRQGLRCKNSHLSCFTPNTSDGK